MWEHWGTQQMRLMSGQLHLILKCLGRYWQCSLLLNLSGNAPDRRALMGESRLLALVGFTPGCCKHLWGSTWMEDIKLCKSEREVISSEQRMKEKCRHSGTKYSNTNGIQLGINREENLEHSKAYRIFFLLNLSWFCFCFFKGKYSSTENGCQCFGVIRKLCPSSLSSNVSAGSIS